MKQSEGHKKFQKTEFLVSLKKLDEISDEVVNEVDIIDLKNPSNGSIGAWDSFEIKKAISLFKHKIQISATLGDIFVNKEFLIKLDQFDSLNLDFIKFGLLSYNLKNLFEKINLLESRAYRTNLVCVVFVDIERNLELVDKNLENFYRCGLRHIMLDTYGKNNGNLLKFCRTIYLKEFILKCKNLDIKVGLAGSIQEDEIPIIFNLKPNIIGFRSAICKLNKRTSSIDLHKIRKLSYHFNLCNNRAMESAGA